MSKTISIVATRSLFSVLPVDGARAGGRRRHPGQDARASRGGGSLFGRTNKKGQRGTARQERDGCARCLPAGARHRAQEQGELTMDINTLRIIVTLATLAAFLGIVLWAYLPSRRQGLERQAMG